ncbi:ROK family transcriptional regulator [Martelella sp. HB161492]|uniref:ROK family transcriptional regulator n=1 Tax=Martelella sp. HB161492 TaxID=2720726 RepID=UPI00159176E9|nr:ROK family transcriptional regulator [Martelella sp. HB161492]
MIGAELMNRNHSQKIDQKTGRAINRQMILNLIRRNEEMSRSDLTVSTGLSAAVVGFVVKDLLEEGYLVEHAPRDSSLGRRPVPLRLNREGHLAIGLKLGRDRLDCVLTDLAMEPLEQRSVPLNDYDPKAVVGCARQAVNEVLRSRNEPNRPILGAGWTMPAHLDTRTGSCLRSFRFGWENVPIGTMLSKALEMPVFVEDDTLAYAQAHHLFGLGMQQQSFGVFAIGEGLFFASVINDQVWRGQIGNAGKVGHIMHQEGGRLCECGRHGCLQAYYSVTAMQERWQERGNPTDLATAVIAQDPAALELVRDAGATIGRHLAQWNTLIDHEMIIFGGESTSFGDAFMGPMREAFDHYYYREKAPSIITDETGYYWTAGAAAVVVQHVFDGPHVN